MKNIIRLFKIAKPWRHLIILSSISLLVITGINLVTPKITKMIISIMETDLSEDSIGFIVALGLSLLGINLIRSGLQFVVSFYQHVTSWRLVAKIRCMIYEHFQSLSMSYYHDKQTGTLMSCVVNDTMTFENLVAHAIPDLATNIITFVSVLVILFRTNAMLTLIVCIPIPFIAFLSTVMRKIRRNFRRAQEEAAALNAALQDDFSGMKEIQLFNKQAYEAARVKELADAHANAHVKAMKYSSILHPTVGMVSSLGTVIVLIFGPIFALNTDLAIADVVEFLLYLGMFYAPVSSFARLLEDIQRALAGADRVFEVLDTPSEITDKPDAVEVGRLSGAITFDNVSFEYNENIPVLKNINLDIKAGEMVALVGPTGVGKSTISSLIARFYDPTEGHVKFDGINIDDMTLHCLRNQLSMVMQDVFLFNGSIAENIAYGCESATMEQIIEAAKTACIDDFVESLPDKYETMIGERGVRLSGGQKQRISIARAILRNSPILVLDEATSAVDTETETHIQEAINKIAGTRTLVVIAHRLSTVKKADKIVVLKEGEIVECGKHDELIKLNGVYSNLCNIQSIM
ncbi:MAG: ABC transporter ATP-binding protein [Clostridia bacterium]|nr:ABC transporter ATP-binding protein [Clostridia bacterium]